MTREQKIRAAVRDFWVHDVNRPSWFTAEQNEQLVQRIVRAVGEYVQPNGEKA
jgi:hypothetical protein